MGEGKYSVFCFFRLPDAIATNSALQRSAAHVRRRQTLEIGLRRRFVHWVLVFARTARVRELMNDHVSSSQRNPQLIHLPNAGQITLHRACCQSTSSASQPWVGRVKLIGDGSRATNTRMSRVQACTLTVYLHSWFTWLVGCCHSSCILMARRSCFIHIYDNILLQYFRRENNRPFLAVDTSRNGDFGTEIVLHCASKQRISHRQHQ